ncbi:MAG: rhodanese [Alphaproteobacteria bacterium]|nr:rhodanese [Alphaproteobacteria bacterium]
MIRKRSARDGNALLHAGGEVAFLDLREAGPYSQGHPLFATHCPFSLLEARIGPLVPNLAVPLLLIDGGDGIAQVGAQALAGMGYRDISVIEGGAPEWKAAALTLYKGVNVPSKTLGELVEHLWRPDTLDARTLKAWMDEGRDFDFFDCRPPSEYAKMTVPGAICLPNGEVAHRLAALEGDRPLVLTCAGRTRGVIGAAGLAKTDPKRPIYALENGTQGWRLAGFELAFKNDPAPYPALNQAARAATRRRAESLMAAEKIQSVDAAAVCAMLSEPDRTTFLMDVRSAEEAAQDPLPAFTHALSGQLVQATDQWIGVRHARVVLADDLGLRAALSAFWLRALGYETCVALTSDDLRGLPPGSPPSCPDRDVEICGLEAALEANRKGSAVFVDVRASGEYCKGHVAGAIWMIRPKLRLMPVRDRVLLIGDDTPRAILAAQELRRLGHRRIAIVEGGHAALQRAGAAVEARPAMPLSEAIDVTSFAHGRHDGNLDASRLYLEWEQGLLAQLGEAERAEFRL